MSGVVDKNGQQWERCDECGDWVPIEELCWLPATFQTVMATGAGPTLWAEDGGLVLTGPIWVDICTKCAADD